MTLLQTSNLALYHYDSCPFCAKTRDVIDELGLPVDLKNIQKDHQHLIDLQQGGKKQQVPCLRIEQSGGHTQWLYESDDIINFLAPQ